jgi:hypothetical protein
MKVFESACKKLNQTRRMRWSAPAIMTAFIISCMLIILSVESIGVVNKHKSVIVPKENDIKMRAVFTIKPMVEQRTDNNVEQIMKILINGVKDQIEYDRQYYSESEEMFDV